MPKRASYVLTAAGAARRMRKRASYVLTAARAARRMPKRASYVGCVATAARAARRMRKRASYVLTAARAARRMPRRSLMSRRQHALRVGCGSVRRMSRRQSVGCGSVRVRTVAMRGELMKVGRAPSACAPTTLVFLRRRPTPGHARFMRGAHERAGCTALAFAKLRPRTGADWFNLFPIFGDFWPNSDHELLSMRPYLSRNWCVISF